VFRGLIKICCDLCAGTGAACGYDEPVEGVDAVPVVYVRAEGDQCDGCGCDLTGWGEHTPNCVEHSIKPTELRAFNM
jgi:hypothetical protein